MEVIGSLLTCDSTFWSLVIDVYTRYLVENNCFKVKVKQSCYRPEVAQRVPGSFPNFMTMAQDGSKVVGLTHRPPLPTANAPGTHFC